MNKDDKEFDFTAALHTYIEVLHVGQAKVSGLKGKCVYMHMCVFVSMQPLARCDVGAASAGLL